MCQGNAKSPEREIIDSRVVEVVGGVNADYGGKESPCAESPRREGVGVRATFSSFSVVEICGIGLRSVGLDAVCGGDDGDLNGVKWSG